MNGRQWAVHAVALGAGVVVAWFFVSAAWVQFESIVPMLIFGATTVGIAAVLLVLRPRRFAGLAVGLGASAITCTAAFTLLSSGPGLDRGVHVGGSRNR